MKATLIIIAVLLATLQVAWAQTKTTDTLRITNMLAETYTLGGKPIKSKEARKMILSYPASANAGARVPRVPNKKK